MWRLLKLAVLVIVLFGGEARADTPLRALLTGDQTRGFEAVGRIEFGGNTFCTGSLIAPDVVLTAAHCLFDDAGVAWAPGQIRFLAGWRSGRATAVRAVARAVPHPDYRAAGSRNARIAHDLALLRLDQPVSNGAARPFAPAHRAQPGDEVGVVSYAFDRADAPSLQDHCAVLARQAGVLTLSCEVDFGSSGSPVFVLEDGVPRLVSVISGKARLQGRKVALGADLEAPLADLHRLLDAGPVRTAADGPVVSRLVPEGARAGAGARFIRP